MIERNCPHCGKVYLADPKRLKYGRQTSCSRACSYALRAAPRIRNADLTCQVCAVVFTRKPAQARAKNIVVCSLLCYFEARRQGLVTPRPPTKPPILFTCETCGKAVELAAQFKGARHNRFCSNECSNRGNSGAGNAVWRGGHPKYYGKDWRPLQRAARLRDKNTCRRCGSVQTTRKADVHHIKPVSSFQNVNDANTLDNVICLCHKCHMRVEWNGIDFPL